MRALPYAASPPLAAEVLRGGPTQAVHFRRQSRPVRSPVRRPRPPLNQDRPRTLASWPTGWSGRFCAKLTPYDQRRLHVDHLPPASEPAHPSAGPGARCSLAGSPLGGRLLGLTFRSCPMVVSSQRGSARDRPYMDAGSPERRANSSWTPASAWQRVTRDSRRGDPRGARAPIALSAARGRDRPRAPVPPADRGSPGPPPRSRTWGRSSGPRSCPRRRRRGRPSRFRWPLERR